MPLILYKERDSMFGTLIKSIVQNITFHDAASVADNGLNFQVENYKTITIEIYGSVGNNARTVTFYVKGKSGVLRAISGVRLSDLSVAASTTGTGEIWQFDVTGVEHFIVDLTAITGGTVTVKGKAVA